MPAFFSNPIIKIIGALLGLLIVLFFALALLNVVTNSTGLSSYDTAGVSTKQSESGMNMGRALQAPGAPAADMADTYGESSYIPPIATPSGYVPNLEAFETTSYYLSGRIRDFDVACEDLAAMKADDRFHFKTLTASLNSCQATFFTEETYVSEALNQLQRFSGVTTNRNTESVTRHREQIESRGNIIRQQLASVERTLSEAETAYDEIASFARAEQDVEAYSNAIDTKLRQIDQLTQRKISLTSQLESIAQQAADLEERLGVVEISVNLTRSYALNPDKTARAWERAWEALHETWTNFGIGLTAYFGIFILFVVQYSLYLLVLIVVARFGWKVVRKIWQW